MNEQHDQGSPWGTSILVEWLHSRVQDGGWIRLQFLAMILRIWAATSRLTAKSD